MAKDILTDDDRDLIIKANGDLDFGDGDSQALERVALLNPGELKINPVLGYGAGRLINGRFNKIVEEGKLRQQLIADKWVNIKVDINGQDVYAFAERLDE